ncbi:hypothetical protein, partial [Amycolatopsis sp. SID8362]|uniref:hypothetical protein n=1 Tax=Amycolatopsis sp. SID8362 TaxID=2690346 RepID=UPI00136B2816
ALTTARRIGYRAQEARALLGLAASLSGAEADAHLRAGLALQADLGLTPVPTSGPWQSRAAGPIRRSAMS